MYAIERNFPIPKNIRENRKGLRKYPFCEMRVGDSFLIQWNGFGVEADFFTSTKKKINVAAYSYRKSHNSKAQFYCGPDAEFKGARVWRIE